MLEHIAAGQETESAMAERVPIKILMNGVTGRMGYRQHLVRSLLEDGPPKRPIEVGA